VLAIEGLGCRKGEGKKPENENHFWRLPSKKKPPKKRNSILPLQSYPHFPITSVHFEFMHEF